MTRYLFAGAAAGLVLLSACGSQEAANNAGGDLNAATGVPLGNDASAMEIVGNQAAGSIPMQAPAADNASATAPSRTNPATGERGRADETNRSRSAPPPAEDVDDSPPGGDRGGNAAQGNLSGI